VPKLKLDAELYKAGTPEAFFTRIDRRIGEALAQNGRVVVFGSVLDPYDWNAPWGQLPTYGVRKQQMLAFFQSHYQVKPLDRLAGIKAWEIQPRDKSVAQ
jgi:hypothetical protein